MRQAALIISAFQIGSLAQSLGFLNCLPKSKCEVGDNSAEISACSVQQLVYCLSARECFFLPLAHLSLFNFVKLTFHLKID